MNKLISVILAALISGLVLLIVFFIVMCIADDESPIEVIKYYLPKKEVERENKIMNKSIAVIDTPEDCITCDLTRETWDEDFVDIIVCGLTSNEIPYDGKATWCPLKTLHKKRITDSTPILEYCCGWDAGYNACIDEILGGEEENK